MYVTQRTLYSVRKIGTDEWAQRSYGLGPFEGAQIYHKKAPATCRKNTAKRYLGIECEVVELKVQIASDTPEKF